MIDPVFLVRSGETYDRSFISQWLRSRDVDPRTKGPLDGAHHLVTNNTLTRDIRAWAETKLGELQLNGP